MVRPLPPTVTTKQRITASIGLWAELGVVDRGGDDPLVPGTRAHDRTIQSLLVSYHEDGAEYFGRHRSLLDRGEGHRIKQIEWRAANAPARCSTARLRPPRVPCLEGSVPLHNRPYLLAKPLPGRRHPVKAAGREAGARDARQPLPDGAGLAPWRQAGDCVEDVHSPLGTLISPAPVFYRSPIRCHQHRALCR